MSQSRSKLQKYSAPALEKGLEIIEFLAEQDAAKNFKDIAEGIGRSTSEIFRMIVVLEEKGYLARNDQEELYLTGKLFQLSLRNPAFQRLSQIAEPIMQKLAQKTQYCCYLSVASSKSMAVIAQADSPVKFGLSIDVGYNHPLIGSAPGLCMLAHMSERDKQRILADQNQQKTAIAECKDLGFARCPSLIMAHVEDLSVPIIDRNSSNALAALTIPYTQFLHTHTSAEETLAALLQARKEIEESL